MKQAVKFREGPSSEAHTREGFAQFIRDLNVLADSLNLSKEVRKRAGSICADAAAMRFCRVTSRPVLAAAALYVACREYREPVTLRDLADASGSNPRDVGRCYSTILERMHIERPGLNGKSYVHRLTLKRQLSEEVYNLSGVLVRKAGSAGLGVRIPMTLAAASLYVACCRMGENVTLAVVAEAAGVGEESVRECCMEFRALVPAMAASQRERGA